MCALAVPHGCIGLGSAALRPLLPSLLPKTLAVPCHVWFSLCHEKSGCMLACALSLCVMCALAVVRPVSFGCMSGVVRLYLMICVSLLHVGMCTLDLCKLWLYVGMCALTCLSPQCVLVCPSYLGHSLEHQTSCLQRGAIKCTHGQ